MDEELATQDQATEQPQDLRSVLEGAIEGGTAEQTTETAAEKAERVRDEAGRFAKKDEAPKAEATPDPVAAEVQPEQPAQEPMKAPSSWKKEAQALWDKAQRGEPITPQEFAIIHAEAQRREGDFHKGTETYKQAAERARRFEEAIAPYKQTLDQIGVQPEQAVSALFKADHILRTAPASVKYQYFQQLAQQYGVDLNAQIDPRLAQLESEIYHEREARQTLAKQIEQREIEALTAEINAFAEGKEHFAQVQAHMTALVPQVRAENPSWNPAKVLQAAYDMAVYANPTTRAALLEQQRAEAAREAETQRRAKAQSAAAVSVKGSSPASGAASKPSDLRAVLSAAIDGNL